MIMLQFLRLFGIGTKRESNGFEKDKQIENTTGTEGALTEYSYVKEDNWLKLDNHLSFGIEIEFQLKDKTSIKQIGHRLFDEALSTTEELRKYDDTGNGHEWVLKKEATCDFELSSPVFFDTKDTWEQIEKVCNVLTEYGAYTDEKCAIHVHIGLDGILNKGKQWKNLFYTYQKCEPLILKLSGDSSNTISHVRLERYAICMRAAVRYLWRKWVKIDDYLTSMQEKDDISMCSYLFPARELGMNWRCMNEKTIEFRTFNGTLDPLSIQGYIFVVTKLVDKVNESRNLDVNVDQVIKNRQMDDEYIRSIENYLCDNDEFKTFFRITIRNKKDIDDFSWEMLDGSRSIAVKV